MTEFKNVPSSNVSDSKITIVVFSDTEVPVRSCVCCGDEVHFLELRWVEGQPIHWQCLEEINQDPVTVVNSEPNTIGNGASAT